MPSYNVILQPDGFWGTSFLLASAAAGVVVNAAGTSRHASVVLPNWGNVANTVGSAGTSGGAGTTIVAAGNYTWIG